MLIKTALLATFAVCSTFASAFDFVGAVNAYKITSDAERGGTHGDAAKIEWWGKQIDKGDNLVMFDWQRTDAANKDFQARFAESGITISGKPQLTKPFSYTIKGKSAVEMWQVQSFTDKTTQQPQVVANRVIVLCEEKQLGEDVSLYFDPSKDPMVLTKHYFIPLAWNIEKVKWRQPDFDTACGTHLAEAASAPAAATPAAASTTQSAPQQ